jgi:hypothetical protein
MTEPWRGDDDEDVREEEAEALPDGVIPLPGPPQRGPGGCGLVGCLYGTIVMFSVALVLLLIALATRIWITTSMPRM